MPLLFNTQQPASIPQLDQLYTGDPNVTPDQVDSNLFLQSSQVQDYIHKQASNLGIGDPVAYYNQQLLARKMANTPSGAQMNAMRAVGQYDPKSLPGQLTQRDNMWDRVAANNQADSQQFAALQNANNDRYYPLPATGAPIPTMSPVARTAMAQQGITNPMQFLMQQRLGSNRSMVDTSGFKNLTSQGINSDELFSHPSFQSFLAKNPQGSAQVFQALTGQPFQQFSENYVASKKAEQTRAVAALTGHLDKGEATMDKDGNIQWREMLFDPTLQQFKPTGKVLPANPYQKSLEKYLPLVDATLGRKAQLEAKGPATTPASIAALQNSDQQIPQRLQATSDTGMNGLIPNFIGGVVNTADNMASVFQHPLTSSLWKAPFENTASAYGIPAGVAPTHAAPFIRNNAKLQQLIKTNPQAAQRLIQAIQQSGYSDSADKVPFFQF